MKLIKLDWVIKNVVVYHMTRGAIDAESGVKDCLKQRPMSWNLELWGKLSTLTKVSGRGAGLDVSQRKKTFYQPLGPEDLCLSIYLLQVISLLISRPIYNWPYWICMYNPSSSITTVISAANSAHTRRATRLTISKLDVSIMLDRQSYSHISWFRCLAMDKYFFIAAEAVVSRGYRIRLVSANH